MATLKERVDRHHREIAAIRKLVVTGMKMLVANEKQIRDNSRLIHELQVQQRETSRELQAFIRSLRRGGNGHTRGRSIH